jgi:hypothetical protein
MRIVDLAVDGASGQSSFPTAAAIDPALGWRTAVSPDADGRRIVTYDAGLHLRDGATGALVATLVEGTAATGTLFLADGRVVVQGAPTEPASTQARLWVFDRVGTKLAEVEVPLPPWSLGIGPEVAPGHVFVWDGRAPYLPSQDTLLVDVASGQVIERLPGLRPAGPSSAATTSVHYFRSAEAAVVRKGIGISMPLVRIDFASGERTVVAGPGAQKGERITAR